MSETVSPETGAGIGPGGLPGRRAGRRAVELCAAALAGASAGFLAGWLVFAGAASGPSDIAPQPGSEPPAARLSSPKSVRIDPRPELSRLAESVKQLCETVERLATSQSERPNARPAVSHSERPRPAAQERRQAPPIAPGVKFHDTFETGTDGWFVARFAPMIVGDIARTEEEGQAKEGKGALALSYTLDPGKIPVALRMAKGINRLSLWIRTLDQPAQVVVGVQEGDESDYHTMLHIEPGEGWKHFEFDLATFDLGDDSEDENDRLDIDQIRSVAVADVAAFVGGKGPNVLLIDEVRGEYRAENAPAPAEKQERF